MRITKREEYMIKRRRKGIKIKDIAEAIGKTSVILSRYENGEIVSPEVIRAYEGFIDQRVGSDPEDSVKEILDSHGSKIDLYLLRFESAVSKLEDMVKGEG